MDEGPAVKRSQSVLAQLALQLHGEITRADMAAGEADLPSGRDYHLGRAAGYAEALAHLRIVAHTWEGDTFESHLPRTTDAAMRDVLERFGDGLGFRRRRCTPA